VLVSQILISYALEKSDDVIELNYQTFQELVIKRTPADFFLVELYSPHCGVCKNFASSYDKVGDYLRGIVQVGRINVEDSENKPIIEQYHANGVPFIMLFPVNNAEPITYEIYPRTPNNIVKWTISFFEPIITLDNSAVTGYIFCSEEKEIYPNRFLLLHSGIELPTAFTNLAKIHQGEAIFGSYDVTAQTAISLPAGLNVESYPAIVVHKALSVQGDSFAVYSVDSGEELDKLFIKEDIVAPKQLSGSFFVMIFVSLLVLLGICVCYYFFHTKKKLLSRNVMRS